MNIMFILVLAIIIINAYIGKRIGLIKIIFSMISIFISIGLALIISPFISDLIRNNNRIHTNVYKKVESTIEKRESKEKTKVEGKADYIKKLGLPKHIEKILTDKGKDLDKSDKITKEFRNLINEHITQIMIKFISFIVTFIVVFILVWILSLSLNILSKLPIISSLNNLGGMVAGIIQGIIIVYIIFAIILVFNGTKLGKESIELIEKNKILMHIYNKNYIVEVILSKIKK